MVWAKSTYNSSDRALLYLSKVIKIGGPNSYQFREVFYPKIFQKGKYFFSQKKGFGGVKPGPLESTIIQQLANQKILGGYYNNL